MDEPTEWNSRTRLLYGDDGAKRIASGRVLVAGLGAVGSFAVEALARNGVGALTLVDFDRVEPSNVNRQLYALHSTVGKAKVELAAARVRDINPACAILVKPIRLSAENIGAVLAECRPDAVIDAIDDLHAKVSLLTECLRLSIPVVSSMGAARRTDPSALRFGALGEVRGCPLAKNLRRLLRRSLEAEGIALDDQLVVPVDRLCCVYSTEPPLPPACKSQAVEARAMGSTVCVTGAFGLFAASKVIRLLAG